MVKAAAWPGLCVCYQRRQRAAGRHCHGRLAPAAVLAPLHSHSPEWTPAQLPTSVHHLRGMKSDSLPLPHKVVGMALAANHKPQTLSR